MHIQNKYVNGKHAQILALFRLNNPYTEKHDPPFTKLELTPRFKAAGKSLLRQAEIEGEWELVEVRTGINLSEGHRTYQEYKFSYLKLGSE